MSAKADKGDRKREIEQSPMKKKFRDSAISSEELDSAIASRIELAFKEHQSTLNSVVNSAVRDAMDSVLIPALRELREDILATNKSVRELREEFEAIVTKTKQTRDRVDSVQAAADLTVTDLKDQLERLTEKMTDMEDRCRRNNVRLVGLPEGMEGPDAAVFLRANLSKWIPSLRGRDIEIDRAHRVYDGGRGSDRPRTLIFRVLRWHDQGRINHWARRGWSPGARARRGPVIGCGVDWLVIVPIAKAPPRPHLLALLFSGAFPYISFTFRVHLFYQSNAFILYLLLKTCVSIRWPLRPHSRVIWKWSCKRTIFDK